MAHFISPRRWDFFALLIYAATSFLILDHGISLTGKLLGGGSDIFLATWFLAWWPWAILHHLNPLYTSLVWQPHGLHLAWTTCIPLLALLSLPFTLLSGPVLSYNLLTLAAPVLAAYAAYLLCRRFTPDPAAALIGGFLFGFSPYEMAATFYAVNLDFVVFVPCAVILAIDRLNGQRSRRQTVLLLSLVLSAQFYVSVEIFATLALFSAIAWCAAVIMIPERRAMLLTFSADILCCVPVVALLTAPLLLPMLLGPRDVSVQESWVFEWAAEPGNMLIPSVSQLANAPGSKPQDFTLFGLVPEADFTTGLPLLVMFAWLAARHWRDRAIRFAFVLLAVILLASLGPLLWIDGKPMQIALPWAFFLKIPFIDGALPVRFTLYSSLVSTVLAAVWISGGRRWRVVFGVLACLLFLPAPHGAMQVPYLHFFAPQRLEAVLGPRPKLLILPQTTLDVSTFWQMQNRFGFAQTQGYLGMPPDRMARYMAVRDFILAGPLDPGFGPDFRTLCLATGTQFVIAGPHTPAGMLRAITALGWPARAVDEVTVFTVPGNG